MSYYGYKHKKSFSDYLAPIGSVLVGLLVVAVIVFAVIASVKAQKECEAMGGVYEEDGECEVDGRDLVEYD